MDEQPKRKRKSGWDAIPEAPTSSTKQIENMSQNSSSMFNYLGLGYPTHLNSQTSPLLLSLSPNIPNLSTTLLPNTSQGNLKLDGRIYVGSLNYDLGTAEVSALFSCFGQIINLDLSHDSVTNKSKGYCFIEYADPASALAAESMNGFEIAGRKIKVGRPFNGAFVSSNTPITPQQKALQQAAMMAIGAGNLLPKSYNTLLTSPSSNISIPSSVSSNLGTSVQSVSQNVTNATILTLAQQLAKEKAQALLDKLSKSAASIPIADAAISNSTKSIVVKNVRVDIASKELSDVFSSFGQIISTIDVGEPYTMMSILGVPTSVKTVQITYEMSQYAKDALTMNDKNLVGMLLTVELLPLSLSPTNIQSNDGMTSSSSIQSLHTFDTKTDQISADLKYSESSKKPKKLTVVKMENLVSSVSEIFEDDFQDDIKEEAATFGSLKSLKILLNSIDITKVSLAEYNVMQTKMSSIPEGKDIFVLLYYNDVASALKASTSMNGRYFAGKTLKAVLVAE